ncbi:hypothetical protein AVEN_242896-1 [Araneus ventricosus]|uniref:Uncharacterized protein n=1 Tax=Araneus ventricosus TaxID=182803 RepID=A0A4Y2RYC8_ARAVE|nr:hypothetical protein AVEN_242896-1 [Araneus ventricosus]
MKLFIFSWKCIRINRSTLIPSEKYSKYDSEVNHGFKLTTLDDIRSDSEDGDTLPHQDESSSDFSVDEGPQPFSQSELNDLVRELGLFKDGAEFLGSRLKNKNLLTPGTSFSSYREVEK